MFKERFYKAVLNICMFFYLAFINEYLTFKGFFRLVFVFRSGEAYYIHETHKYYQYIGWGMFKEGNKTLDYGTYSIETDGGIMTLGLRDLGVIHFDVKN